MRADRFRGIRCRDRVHPCHTVAVWRRGDATPRMARRLLLPSVVANATIGGADMKAFAFPLALTLAAGFAGASDMPKASHKHGATAEAKGPSTMLAGEVVSTDPSGNKLVLKTASGDETLTVTGKAAAGLNKLTAGERVVVKERNNEVYSIKAAKGKSKHHASANVRSGPAASRRY
jgi:hypothetical protein